jgi:alcohol dehydrogenase class IV
MGLHHKLCHIVGGLFDLPHALAHAILLPEVTAHNAEAAPEAMARVARVLEVEDAAAGLRLINARLGIHQGLGDLGMPADGIDTAIERLLADGCSNPRALEREPIRELLCRAHGSA